VLKKEKLPLLIPRLSIGPTKLGWQLTTPVEYTMEHCLACNKLNFAYTAFIKVYAKLING
jgi:hypothetical protein